MTSNLESSIHPPPPVFSLEFCYQSLTSISSTDCINCINDCVYSVLRFWFLELVCLPRSKSLSWIFLYVPGDNDSIVELFYYITLSLKAQESCTISTRKFILASLLKILNFSQVIIDSILNILSNNFDSMQEAGSSLY